MSLPPLILASTSRFRAELLGRLGLPWEQEDSLIDEEPWKRRGLSPAELVTQLAMAKAEAVQRRHPGAVVLGADQVAELNGTILGKPGSTERAVEQLEFLSGRTHTLWSAVALVGPCPEQVQVDVDVHQMTMRALGRAELVRYVEREDVLGCAGSYRVEGLGAALFSAMEGHDWTGIIGLPLLTVVRMLHSLGLDPLGER